MLSKWVNLYRYAQVRDNPSSMFVGIFVFNGAVGAVQVEFI